MAGVADRNALRAGLFIVASVALAVGIFVAVEGIGAVGGSGGRWLVRFELDEDVGGLSAGNEVRVGGVKRGSVERVRLADDFSHVIVEVHLPSDLPLREGADVQVQTTVTGLAWLNISGLGEGAPLPTGTIIDGRGGSFADLVTSMAQVAPAVTGLMTDLRGETIPRANRLLTTADETGAELRGTVGSIRLAADRAGNVLGKAEGLMDDNRGRIDQTLANLDAAMARAPALVEETQKLAGAVDGFVADVRGTLGRTESQLSRVLEEGEGVGRAARGAIEGNRGKLDQIVANMRDASRTLELASGEIRRSPWRLLYKPDDRQRESLDLYDAARAFADGASALQDAAVALQDVSREPGVDAARVEEVLKQLDERHRAYREAEQALFRRLSP